LALQAKDHYITIIHFVFGISLNCATLRRYSVGVWLPGTGRYHDVSVNGVLSLETTPRWSTIGVWHSLLEKTARHLLPQP